MFNSFKNDVFNIVRFKEYFIFGIFLKVKLNFMYIVLTLLEIIKFDIIN